MSSKPEYSAPAPVTVPITSRKTALLSRNVNIQGRRTSVRLEREMWDALREVAAQTGLSTNDICSRAYETKGADASFTSALRVYLLRHYRSRSGFSGGVPM